VTRTVHSERILTRQIVPITTTAPTTLCTTPSPAANQAQSNNVHSIPYSRVCGVMRYPDTV
jgi:hypothetical protein